ncbi:MAG: fibronectin type III domain-containing protein [Gemmatales bacterium]|nr:fibronectin type III domain-containing protein [Gemmatales bacterium]MDW8222865.1 fibronectin type III domain-containing protein [Gemmatales bacterium]
MPPSRGSVIQAAAITLGSALGTIVFWWLVLSEEPQVPSPSQMPRTATAGREDREVSVAVNPGTMPPFHYVPAHPSFHVEPYLLHPTPTGISILWHTTQELPGVVEYGESEALGHQAAETGPARTRHEVRLENLKPDTLYYYRVRSGEAVSSIATFRTAPPPGTPRWRIAVYGDSRGNPALHRALAEQISRRNVDLLVHTGNLVTDSNDAQAWQREFFAPLAPVISRIPCVCVSGPPEADSTLFASYFRPLAHQRYFLHEYGNARLIILDSCALERGGREAEQQERWFRDQCRQSASKVWNIVFLHHALFGVQAGRPTSALRSQWTPALIDPAHRIHLVCNGQEPLYARTWPIGLYQEKGSGGVVFVTSAAGTAPPARLRFRAHTARALPAHHFLLLEGNEEELTVTAYGVSGRILDRFVVQRDSPSRDLFCWEAETWRENLRRALHEAPGLVIGPRATTLEGELLVPHDFRVPLEVRLRWSVPPGWRLPTQETTQRLLPGEPLRIPLRAEVHPEATHRLPRLHLELQPVSERDKALSHPLPFHNRQVLVYPFKLLGPDTYRLEQVGHITVDGRGEEEDWQRTQAIWLPSAGPGSVSGNSMLFPGGPAPGISRPDTATASVRLTEAALAESERVVPAVVPEKPPEVRLASHPDYLFVLVRLRDPAQRFRPPPENLAQRTGPQVLQEDHVRLELYDGQKVWSYAVSAQNLVYYSAEEMSAEGSWQGVSAHDGQTWTTEFAIPRRFLEQSQVWKANIVVFLKEGAVQFEWRAQRRMFADAEVVPTWDWRGCSQPENFAALTWPQ